MSAAAPPAVQDGVEAISGPTSSSRGGRRHRPRRNPQDSAGSANTSADEAHAALRNGGQANLRPNRGAFAPRLDDRPRHTPPTSDLENLSHSDSPRTNGRRGRGGRSRGARTGAVNGTQTVTGRQFGGALTNGADDDAQSQPDINRLQAHAPAFIPGQLGPAPKVRTAAHRMPQPRQRRLSKSQAPDIASRTHEDIEHGHYECAVCTSEIYRNSKVWSCHTCWTVFHMSCVKKWSQSEGAKVAQRQQTGDSMVPLSQQWRCPGCNLPQDRMPSTFTCWCEKEADPRSVPGLPPFSCGQSCHREHTIPKRCPHPCSSVCHAGPCAPCPLKGPTQSCFCGRETSTKRCVDTNYETGFSCGQVCGEMMPCGEHTCEQPCHEGLCGACEVPVEAKCYCGQVDKEILCYERGDIKPSKHHHRRDSGGPEEDWLGSFNCGNVCNRDFDCGKHTCDQPCHSQDEQTPHCPRSPDIITQCPCGKTPLNELTSAPRTSCDDNIPLCRKACLKTLGCGHECQRVCHSGDCPPCMTKTTITCRCGRMTIPSLCHQGQIEPPECMRVCRATLNCGRHECGEHCCTGERKASERQATKRKLRPLGAAPRAIDEGVEAEHICTRTCGRPLKCGNHTCPDLCHKGPCHTCREAIFEEISCHCGRTVLQPPLPCGSRSPPCRYQCERPKTCGHPQVAHSCHQDDESCPKCPFLTTKSCLCGKHQLKNQPCWLVDVRCGDVCGRKLKCGYHTCRKPCHRSGECEDANTPCTQQCGKEKSCSHPDESPCHSPFPCKEDKACQYKIYITCDCQRIKQEAKCGATKTNEGNRNKSLKCDDECARLERNRKLALALNIDPEAHTDDHVPYSDETIRMYTAHGKWATEQEKTLRIFAADTEEKRLRWKPMTTKQRAFIHALADDFGFDSESMDPEPHRHVAIWKTPRFVMAPMKTLAECARIRRVQNIAAAAVASEQKAAQQKLKASNLVGEPFNGFVISQPKFALTVDEVQRAIAPVVQAADPTLQLDISFLPSEEVVLKPKSTYTRLADRDLETLLTNLKPTLATTLLTQHHLGQTLQLCRLDPSLNIDRLESDAASSGWSQVAAKAAAPRRTLLPIQPKSGSNSFTVLMSGAAAKKKLAASAASEEKKREKLVRKKAEADVVEDWEVAEEEMERNEGDDREVEVEVEAGRSGDEADIEERDLGDEGQVDEMPVIVEGVPASAPAPAVAPAVVEPATPDDID